MSITITSKNINKIIRFHNYFYNKGLHCMTCNNDTEVIVFGLNSLQAETLLNAFKKHFHLKHIESESLAA